eukprot:3918727-Pyramimonas_sp.AAC.1
MAPRAKARRAPRVSEGATAPGVPSPQGVSAKDVAGALGGPRRLSDGPTRASRSQGSGGRDGRR